MSLLEDKCYLTLRMRDEFHTAVTVVVMLKIVMVITISDGGGEDNVWLYVMITIAVILNCDGVGGCW